MSALKEYFGWIPLTFRNIFRNKRRSFSMISGIVLGVLILVGIVVYINVLNAQTYETVVESAIYEVEFNLLEDETIENLQKIADLIQRDDRIIGSALITQQTNNMFSSFSMDRGDTDTDTSTGDPNVVVQGPGQAVPTFVQQNFSSTPVGEELLEETLFQGELSLEENSTVLPRSIASRYRLQVGDTIDELNITVNLANQQGGSPGELTQNKATLQNVYVSGIYEVQSGDAGLFGAILSQPEIYFSEAVLQEYMPDIDKLFKDEQASFLATKIDIEQFSITDPEEMNNEIQQMINEMSAKAADQGYEVQGTNSISSLLAPFMFTNIFVGIFQAILAIPVVILSLYLLIYGVQLSLEERRREIGIKKVQGADSSQIFGELRNESAVIFTSGLIIGYLLGIAGAWLISTSTGFLQFDFVDNEPFLEFYQFELPFILILSFTILGLILFYLVYSRGKQFIQDQVSEQIQRFKEQKPGFLRRTNLDLALFGFGAIGAVISILEQGFLLDLDLPGVASFFLGLFGPFFLWIGGSAVGIRLAAWVPFKLEKPVFSTRFFADIQRIIKSGLRRRGDTTRLAIIIILTLSIATFSASQGVTEAYNSQRNIEFQVGADYQVSFQVAGDYTSNLTEPDVVENAMGIGRVSNVRVLSSIFSVIGFDIDAELERLQNGNNIAIWQTDVFVDENAEQALSSLANNEDAVYISSSLLSNLNAEIGDTIDLKVNRPLNETESEIVTIEDVKILGAYNYLPGGFAGSNILGTPTFLNQIQAVSDGLNLTSYENKKMNASTFLVDLENPDSISQDQVNELLSDWSQIEGYNDATSLQNQLDNQGSGSYGIPGLLTLNFVVSVIAALIATFTFSAIILERRKQEFAVLRAVGASKGQIYKIAIAENLLLVLTTVVWGTIIGIGITYQFNGLFAFFGQLLGTGGLTRLVIFPWQLIISIGIGTTIGMLFATVISIRSAANQDLSIATRVV